MRERGGLEREAAGGRREVRSNDVEEDEGEGGRREVFLCFIQH
jgi:hypothetical protein